MSQIIVGLAEEIINIFPNNYEEKWLSMMGLKLELTM